MPYENPKQATAIYLDIKRRQGQAAARAFARKHSGDMAKNRGAKPYKSRRSK
jgi:hypothetical protein